MNIFENCIIMIFLQQIDYSLAYSYFFLKKTRLRNLIHFEWIYVMHEK